MEKVGSQWKLIVGTKRNDPGELKVNWHRKLRQEQLPASMWIRKVYGRWTVSFSYQDGHVAPNVTAEDHLNWSQQCNQEQLEHVITGIDRGVARPVQTQDKTY